MDASTRHFVYRRAGNRCEYCHLAVEHEPFVSFHVDHVIARQHGGSDDPSNLCLACTSCNLHKGTNIAGVDPLTGALVRLFHPRRDKWADHFEWHGPLLVGKTDVGRATIAVLKINSLDNIKQREALIEEGVFPRD